jgi:hypothetical protein
MLHCDSFSCALSVLQVIAPQTSFNHDNDASTLDACNESRCNDELAVEVIVGSNIIDELS